MAQPLVQNHYAYYQKIRMGYEIGIFTKESDIDKAVSFGWIDQEEADELRKEFFTCPPDIIIPSNPTKLSIYPSADSVDIQEG